MSRDELWRATNTPAGAATIHATLHARDREFVVEAWGAGAAWALDHAPALLGSDDTGDVTTTHPVVLAARSRASGLRLTATRSVLDVALATVIDQRVTGVEARRTWFALVRALGAPAPGPLLLRLPPTPDRIVSLDDFARRRVGLEARRGAALVAVAREAARLQRAADAGSAVLQRTLEALPGVGPWTAATVAHLTLGDADAVAVGDWHLPRIVGHALAGEPRADDTRMLELLAPFAPQRARVVRLLAGAGLGPPRTSPRAEIPDQVRREARGDRAYRIRRTVRLREH